jgi:endonuclease/exonuclease/phosphatase family metal-dependent hydrolase
VFLCPCLSSNLGHSKVYFLSSDLPWLLMGDFNEVLHQNEYTGLANRSHAQMEGFRDMIDVCGLHDLCHNGN